MTTPSIQYNTIELPPLQGIGLQVNSETTLIEEEEDWEVNTVHCDTAVRLFSSNELSYQLPSNI